MSYKISHTVQTTTLDISYPSEQSYNTTLPRIDKSFQKILSSVIERAFDEFGKEGTYLALEKIEIDLGDFRPADIETVLPQRVYNQIRNVLKSNFTANTVAGASAEQKQAESLLYYFERGYLPWWLPVENVPTIDKWLTGEIASNKGIVGQFRSLPRSTAFVNRILGGILEPTLQEFIKTLEPGNYNLILDYRKNAERVIKKEKNGKLEANGKYSKVVTIILHYLLNDRGTFFNSTQFLTNTLQKISAHYNIEYATLLHLLQNTLALTQATGSYNSILNAIKQVTNTELPNKPATTPEETPVIPNTLLTHFKKQTSTKNKTIAPDVEATFRLFLSTIINKGTGAFGSSVSTAEIDMVFGFMFRNYGADLKAILYQPQNRSRKAFFISRLCSDKVIEGIINLMEPAQANSIIAYRNKINKLPAENVGIKDTSKKYKQVVNEVIIAYLMLKKQSLFNTRQFIITTITNLAARYNIEANNLFLSLARSLQSDNSHINYKAELFEIIKSITSVNDSEVLAGSIIDKPKQLKPYELLAFYLRNSYLPARITDYVKNEKGEADVAGYLKKMLTDEGEKSLPHIVLLIREFYADNQSRNRLLKLISSENLYEKLFTLFNADLTSAGRTLQYFHYWFYYGFSVDQARSKLLESICEYIVHNSNYSHTALIKWLVSSHLKNYKQGPAFNLLHLLYFSLNSGNNVKALLFSRNSRPLSNWQGKNFLHVSSFSRNWQFNKQIQSIIKEELAKQIKQSSDSTFIKIIQLLVLLKDNKLIPAELSFIVHLPIADLKSIWSGQKVLPVTFTKPANFTNRQIIIYSLVKLFATGKLTTTEAHKLRHVLVYSNDTSLIISLLNEEEREKCLLLISKNKIPPQHTATLNLFAQVLNDEENGVKIKPAVFWAIAIKRIQQISAFNIKNTLAKILTDISILQGKNTETLIRNLIHNLIAFDRPEYRGVLNLLISLSGNKTMWQHDSAAKSKAVMDKLKLAEVLKKKQKPRQPEPEEDIYVSNSGLCLLQGYIPRLFSMLKYTEDGAFVNDNARAKAIRMQQFLVTGFDNDDDFHLVLNKILCGAELDFVVDTNVTLSDEEKQTGINMLKGVIQNWPEIKNSSVEGLRGNFLIRNGKIVNKDGTRRLSVEKKPYDLLLKTLPWGFTLIKHKWMDKPLTVEWI